MMNMCLLPKIQAISLLCLCSAMPTIFCKTNGSDTEHVALVTNKIVRPLVEPSSIEDDNSFSSTPEQADLTKKVQSKPYRKSLDTIRREHPIQQQATIDLKCNEIRLTRRQGIELLGRPLFQELINKEPNDEQAARIITRRTCEKNCVDYLTSGCAILGAIGVLVPVCASCPPVIPIVLPAISTLSISITPIIHRCSEEGGYLCCLADSGTVNDSDIENAKIIITL